MLARRFQTILPDLSKEEIIDVIKIYSTKGLLKNKNYISIKRPFRSPHHTSSYYSLTGGGMYPKPGEISLAHHGTLLLDEMGEFNGSLLETLRQPLEDGIITISRSNSSITYPSRFILIGTMNPCKCGFAFEEEKECKCPPSAIKKYWSKISGPLLDRIDLIVYVPKLTKDEMLSYKNSECSNAVKKRVIETRYLQTKRYKCSTKLNSSLTVKEIKNHCVLTDESYDYLKNTLYKLLISGRTYNKILKVARTIADMEKSDNIKNHHLAESINYCNLMKINMLHNIF